MTKLNLRLITNSGETEREVNINRAIIAGWTSRNREAVEAHIKELEELGVPRPETTPCYYPVSASRLTTAPEIEVLGGDSSGEVEFVMLKLDGELWIGVGSDHTDREAETYDVGVSKQMCDKPISATLWRFADLEDHWDDLEMRSYIVKDGERTLYQEGKVNEMLHPNDLIAEHDKLFDTPFGDNSVMFGGTFAAIGGIQYSPTFEFEIVDPVSNRTNSHQYGMQII